MRNLTEKELNIVEAGARRRPGGLDNGGTGFGGFFGVIRIPGVGNPDDESGHDK